MPLIFRYLVNDELYLEEDRIVKLKIYSRNSRKKVKEIFFGKTKLLTTQITLKNKTFR